MRLTGSSLRYTECTQDYYDISCALFMVLLYYNPWPSHLHVLDCEAGVLVVHMAYGNWAEKWVAYNTWWTYNVSCSVPYTLKFSRGLYFAKL